MIPLLFAPMSSTRSRLLRLLLFAAAFVAAYACADASGWLDQVSVEWVRAQVDRAGAWGALVYLAAFCLGVMFYIPGMIFIVAGILAFGKLHGAPLALLGSVVSASVSVAFLRAVGGNLLEEIEKPFIKRLVGKLHDHPVRTIILLRLLMWVSPPLNTALALSGVSQRKILVGTAVGLLPVVLTVALMLDVFVEGL